MAVVVAVEMVRPRLQLLPAQEPLTLAAAAAVLILELVPAKAVAVPAAIDVLLLANFPAVVLMPNQQLPLLLIQPTQ